MDSLAISALIISTLSLIISIINIIDTRSIKNSTHQVQFYPVKNPDSVTAMQEELKEHGYSR